MNPTHIQIWPRTLLRLSGIQKQISGAHSWLKTVAFQNSAVTFLEVAALHPCPMLQTLPPNRKQGLQKNLLWFPAFLGAHSRKLHLPSKAQNAYFIHLFWCASGSLAVCRRRLNSVFVAPSWPELCTSGGDKVSSDWSKTMSLFEGTLWAEATEATFRWQNVWQEGTCQELSRAP